MSDAQKTTTKMGKMKDRCNARPVKTIIAWCQRDLSSFFLLNKDLQRAVIQSNMLTYEASSVHGRCVEANRADGLDKDV